MIVIDLEWNSGLYTSTRLDEILQIGAVKVDLDRRRIVDSYNAYLRPLVHRRYSPAAGQLPDLALSERSKLDFPAALEEFLAWCGGDMLFASWGNSDLPVLIQNQKFWGLTYPLPSTFVDLQLAFGRQVGCGNNLSLERVCEYCRVPDIFDPHNALYDAMSAWVVSDRLPLSLLLEAVREAGQPLPKGQKALPRRAKAWAGPFSSLSATLNNRGCRRANCPRCAAVNRVDQWLPGQDGYYYARFSCQGCKRGYLLRLEVYRDKKGRFWGNSAVFRAVGAHQRAYQDAVRDAQPIPCAKTRPRRRRRRKPSASPKS